MNAWILSALALAATVALPFAAPTTADDPIELKLEHFAGGPLRTVQGDLGGKPRTFLFDTGGGITVLSTTLAKQLGCPVFGRGTGFRHDGSRVDGPRGGPVDLTFGNYRRRAEVGVLDLDAMLQGLPKVDGIVCLETFAGRTLTVDMAHDRVVLETASSFAARIQGAAELKVRIGHQAGGASLDLFVAIEGKHGPLWFEMDSGNTQPVLIAPHAFAELGLDALPVGKTGHVELPIHGLGKVACEVESKELIYDGLLNAAFFGHHVVTMDLERGRAWVRPVVTR
jgi:hypothetical protein